MTSRPEPSTTGGERELLLGFLDYHRSTLAWKCENLTPEQLAWRATPPSTMSLLGLVRHLAEVESGWFRAFNGEGGGAGAPYVYSTAEQPDLDFDGAVAEPDVVERAFADWQAEIMHAREIVASAALDQTFVRDRDGQTFSLRWLLIHMIEEYARHNGHADLLREAIDGATGE